MALLVFYLGLCVVRMTMPGIDARSRNGIFMIRIAFGGLGVLAAYGFWSIAPKIHLIRDPNAAGEYVEYIGRILFCFLAAVGEYVTRRRLRKLGIFPANKPIPWTY